MIETLSIREMESKADNIYEAVVVLSKRSRQINNEQKQLISSENDYDEEYDEFDEDEMALGSGEAYIKLPKPVDVSIEEFLTGKLRHDYATADDAEEEKS